MAEKIISRINLKLVFFGLLFFGLWALNLYLMDVDVLIFDQLVWVTEYDEFVQGTLSPLQLWEPYGGHRLPGYKLLFYLNCWLFGFSPQLESLTAIIPFILAGTFLSHRFTETLNFGKFTKLLLFLTFTFLFFNPQTFRETYYSLIITQLFDYVGFLIVASLAFQMIHLDKNKSRLANWPFFILSVLVFILFFGRGYGVGAAASIIALCLIELVRKPKSKTLWLVSAVFALTIIVYFIGLEKAGPISSDLKPTKFIRYLILKFGNANIGMFVMTKLEDASVFYSFLVGVFLLLLTFGVFLGYLRIKQKSWADWMAMFLIFISLNALILISAMRSDDGMFFASPFFPRHNLEISLGFVGLFYFVLKFLNRPEVRAKASYFIVPASLIICGVLTHHHYKQVQFESDRRWFQAIENGQIRYFSKENPVDSFNFNSITCLAKPPQCAEIMEET